MVAVWQENLFNNLLVLTILFSIAIVSYLKIKKKSFIEFIKDLRKLDEELE